jgi:hypothetical protein
MCFYQPEQHLIVSAEDNETAVHETPPHFVGELLGYIYYLLYDAIST